MLTRCTTCGREAHPLDWRCTACGGVLWYDVLPAFDPHAVQKDEFSLWRYARMLPVTRRATLGEGMTALSEHRVNGVRFWAKQEYRNPTGSYKDRGAATMLNHLATQGVREVVEDSSGNAGAAVAAYASALGIRARVFVPATAAPAKKALIQAFGGELVEVAGDQHAKTLACEEAAKTTPYASHAWRPDFLVGQMTAAYEVWEQLGRRAPDAVVTPVGHGAMFLGFAWGFQALHTAGLIDSLPVMFAVQSARNAPFVAAYQAHATTTQPFDTQPTLADGIIVKLPVHAKSVLERLYATGGAAFAVDEEAIAAATHALHRHGLIAEPTSAVTFAALPQVFAHLGTSAAQVLCALTGNALKYVGR